MGKDLQRDSGENIAEHMVKIKNRKSLKLYW